MGFQRIRNDRLVWWERCSCPNEVWKQFNYARLRSPGKDDHRCGKERTTFGVGFRREHRRHFKSDVANTDVQRLSIFQSRRLEAACTGIKRSCSRKHGFVER